MKHQIALRVLLVFASIASIVIGGLTISYLSQSNGCQTYASKLSQINSEESATFDPQDNLWISYVSGAMSASAFVNQSQPYLLQLQSLKNQTEINTPSNWNTSFTAYGTAIGLEIQAVQYEILSVQTNDSIRSQGYASIANSDVVEATNDIGVVAQNMPSC